MVNSDLSRRTRLAVTVVIVFHLLVICIHNTWASLEGWCRIRDSGDVPAVAAAVRQTLQQTALTPIIHGYARLTGLNTGYTFFAPQVGSFYHYEAACLAGDDINHRVVYRPALSGSQGYLRYQNFLELFHALQSESPAEDTERRYARAVAKSMARHLLPDLCPQYRIKVGVYAPRSLPSSSTIPELTIYTLYTDTLTAKPLP